MNREEAIRKAAKLLRLATSSNPNEAATAAAHAQEIMDRHGIEAAALVLDGSSAPDRGPMLDSARAGAPLDGSGRERWRGVLAVMVCELNGCHAYKGGGELHLIGRADSAEAARYMYAWTSGEVARQTARAGSGLGVSWRNNFALGMAETIGRRLREQRAETVREVQREADAAGGSVALVRIERALEVFRAEAGEAAAWGRANLRLRSITSRTAYNPGAREQGRAAGQGVALGGSRGQIGARPRMIGGRS